MLASPSVRSNLEPRFLFSERVKARGDEILATIQTIQKAVRQDRRISFNYWHYVPVKLESNEENQPDSGKKESEFLKKKPDDREKKLDVWEKDRILKTKGDRLIEHVVSPWYTVWNNDRYYLVGWSHKKNDIGVYRIDRIAAPKTDPNRKREKEPEGFNIREYTEQVFGMYTGTKTVVTLRCRHSILDQVIDKFGEEIKLENVTRDTFDITVPVHVAGTFYAWVVTYSGEMTIISPEGVCEAYVRYALMNEQYMEDEIDYAIANLECSWELEAVGAAWNWLDEYPDSTHDELHDLLVLNSWFTSEEADYACSYVGK